MPAALKKCTWFINQGASGWSETWYQPAEASRTQALAAMQGVTPFRQALLVQSATIVGLRVSDESILGDSVVDFGAQGRGYPGQATAALQDVPGAALFCRATVGSQRRAVIVRGMPDSWCQYDTNGLPVFKDLLKAFGPWTAALRQKGFGLRVVNQAAPRKPISDVTIETVEVGPPAVGGYFVKAVGHGIQATDGNGDASIYLVHAAKFANPSINRANGHSLVNGRWQFKAIPADMAGAFPPADWLYLPSKVPAGVGDPGYVSGGFVQAKPLIFGPLDDISDTTGIVPEKFGIRKTGRAFFAQRGRARVARF